MSGAARTRGSLLSALETVIDETFASFAISFMVGALFFMRHGWLPFGGEAIFMKNVLNNYRMLTLK